MPNKVKLILFIIFCFAFALFSIYSTFVFPTPNWDEVSFAYNTFTIIKTGQDEWGRWLPLIFRAFGDYKLPMYVYTSIPSIAILGLNTYAIRLVSIFSGALFPIILFFIAKQLKLSTKTSLLIALISTLNPWHLWLSSTALESNLALTLFALVSLFGIKYLQNHSLKDLIINTIFLGLTMHTYNSYRLLAPLVFVFLISTTITTHDPRSFKKIKIPIIIFTLFLLPVIYQTYMGYGKARFDIVSLFKDPGVKLSVEADRNFPHIKSTARIFHNKITYTTQKLTNNYLLNFSPEFLFLKGGTNLAFSPPSYGHFYWWEILLWLVGLILIIKKTSQSKNKPLWLFFLFILLISPLPATITIDGAHTLRSYSLLLPSLIFIGLTLNQIKTRIFLIPIAFVYLISFFFFNEYALKHYPKHYDSHWLSAENQAVKYVVDNQNNFDLIVIPKDSVDEGYIFYLFYSQMDPKKFQSVAKRRFDHNWYWVDQIGAIHFPEKIETLPTSPHRSIIGLTKTLPSFKHRVLATFTSQDGKTNLKVVTFTP